MLDENWPKPRSLFLSQPASVGPVNTAKSERQMQAGKKPGLFFVFFGIMVPAAALLFEWQTHFCARHFFDPFPSNVHMMLFGLVPLTNLLIWLCPRVNLSSFYSSITLLAGMAMGVSVMYSLMFLPLVPLSLAFALAVGFGLLGLSPMFGAICLWRGGGFLSGMVRTFGSFFDPHLVKHVGHLIVLVAVVGVEFPSTVTRYYLQMAADPQTSLQGIRMLRQYGSEEVMLRACYERSGRATDILGSLCEFKHPLEVEEARNIFYRVTGKPFNSVPIPASARATIQHAGVSQYGHLNAGVTDEFDLDTDIAGENVATVARGLALAKSTVQGKLDASGLAAKFDWIGEFANSSSVDREMRAKVLLPHNSVVTGASVFMSGKEIKAQIELRSEARAAYKAAVNQRSGPLLVSLSGPDTVLVQCYPVPSKGSLKVLLTVACPLALNAQGEAIFSPPVFAERNFQLPSQCAFELDGAGNYLTFAAGKGAAAGTTIRSDAGWDEIACGKALLHVRRTGEAQQDGGSLGYVSSGVKIGTAPAYLPKPAHLTVLVDGSNSLALRVNELKSALAAIPPGPDVHLAVASDEPVDFARVQSSDLKTSLEQLQAANFAGGQDNAPCLANWLASHKGDSGAAILWIHAAQPQYSSAVDCVKGYLADNNLPGPIIYDLPINAAPNRTTEGIYKSNHLIELDRIGSTADQIAYLVAAWYGKANPLMVRIDQAVATQSNDFPAFKPSYPQQIWAFDQILNLQPSHSSPISLSSLKLARQYQVVSPVSSAVALQPQYRRRIHHKSASGRNPVLPKQIKSLFRASTSSLSALSGGLSQLSEQKGAMERSDSALRPLAAPSGAGGRLSGGMAGNESADSDKSPAEVPELADASGTIDGSPAGADTSTTPEPDSLLLLAVLFAAGAVHIMVTRSSRRTRTL